MHGSPGTNVVSVRVILKPHGPLQNRVHHYIRTRRKIFRPGVLKLVMTDAIFARDQNHARGANIRHVDRVVSGPRINIYTGDAERG